MADAILALNAGSSSVKFSVLVDQEQPGLLLRGQIEGLRTEPRFTARDTVGNIVSQRTWATDPLFDHARAIDFLLRWGGDGVLDGHRIIAAGHRVVHGGVRFTHPVRIDDVVLAELDALVPLAPLHQPHNIAAIRAVAHHTPTLPQVACFDTSFHRSQPSIAQSIALPRRYAELGVRRYGFHGLSYEYIASALPGVDARAAAGRTIIAHLGNGASMCALQGSRSVATTMGFTALDGLVMGTRCGAIDPGVLLFLMDRHGMDARALEQLLYHQSGLLGVSEISGDMRTLLASEDRRAEEAIDLFVYRIRRELGSLAAALGGLDALIFTGGIGENSPAIRARLCDEAAWLGLLLDKQANERGDLRISRAGSRVATFVIPTQEDLMIVRHTRRVLAPTDSRA